MLRSSTWLGTAVASGAAPALPVLRVRRRWSSCCATWRRTASPPTSRRAATATSCGRSPSSLYGIPPERVIGSALGLDFDASGDDTQLMYKSKIEFFDDGPQKPVRIWSRVGRRPLVAGGNSNGDIPMLRFARTGPQGRHCGCWCCTTTPNANSPTPRAPRTLSTGPRRTAGRSSASRTTGEPSSRTSEAAGTPGTGDYFWSMRTRLPDGSRTAQSRGPHG